MGQVVLKEKVAVVTGASRGIGRAIAIKLAEEGANLVLIARSKQNLEKVMNEVIKLGVNAYICEADLQDIYSSNRIIEETINTFGKLDFLINNAGVAIANTIENTTAEQWDLHMNVNVRAPFLLSKEAIPHLRKSDAATIINIASVVGRKGYINQGAYTASKHALMGMTKVLAQEAFDDNIRVHVISPGGVETEMVTKTRPDLDTSMLASPEDIADIIIFLLKHRGKAVIDEINVRRFSKQPWQ